MCEGILRSLGSCTGVEDLRWRFDSGKDEEEAGVGARSDPSQTAQLIFFMLYKLRFSEKLPLGKQGKLINKETYTLAAREILIIAFCIKNRRSQGS